jgi:predicted Zn-dependent protease
MRLRALPVRKAYSSLSGIRSGVLSMVAKRAVGIVVLLQAALFATGLSAPSAAQGLIRDAEIEHTIRAYATPLLRAASLVPEDVNFHLLRSPELNAFVARGQRIFLSTGLLMRSEHPGQVIGVIAHEIGHITGGHLARLEGAISDAEDQALIGSIIGIAIGVLAGDPGAAAAGSAKAQDIALQNLLKFSRTQERSADQVAVNLLDQTQASAKGLLEFFEVLQDQELLHRSRQDSYVITHPLTRDRIAFMEDHVAKSRYSNAVIPSALKAEHDRMTAKLAGFLNPTSKTLRDYKADDPSVAARYARSIAYYRDANLKEALPLIDSLIAQMPDDPWFQELKGQMLFENARGAEALPFYQKSVDLRPNEPLLRVGLAHVLIELDEPGMIQKAEAHLKQALRRERYMPIAWRLAAITYGRNGELGLSALSLAEYNLLTGHPFDAMGQAQKAMRLLKEGEPAWLRAQDLFDTAERQHKKNRKN